MESAKEKRKRVARQGEVIINSIIRAEMLDLSEAGMYIYTNYHFVPGTIIDLNFPIGGERLTVTAKVRHFQPGVGMGVQFLGLSGDAAKKLKDIMKAHDKDAEEDK